MGKGGGTDFPQDAPRAFALDEDQLPSNEQGRPIPYFAGRRPIGLIYIGQPFRRSVQPKFVQTKKDPVEVGQLYFFSFVAMLCGGVLTGVAEVRIEGELVWSGNSTFGGADYLDLAIPQRGNLRIYKGSETQTQDAHAALALADVGDFHPAYRGIAYCVAEDWFIGFNNASVPAITITPTRYPTFAWHTAATSVQLDANPVAVLADMILNPRAGLGAPSSRLNTSGLNTIAARLATECAGLSPYVKTQTTLRQFAAERLELIDGYILPSADGKFSIGLMREPTGTPPTFDETSLLEPPEIDPGDWSKTLNQVNVNYTNRGRDWHKDSEPGFSAANVAVNPVLKTKTFERLDITRTRYAAVLANILAVRNGTPQPTGRLKVRRSQLQSVGPGSIFKLSWGDLGICHWQCRCTSLARPKSGSPFYEIEFEEDRGSFNARYSTPEEQARPDKMVYEPVPVLDQALLELPYSLEAGSRVTQLAILAKRPSLLTAQFIAWRKKASASYEAVRTSSSFAWHGTLYAAYSDSTLLIDTIARLTLTLDGVDTSLSALSVIDLPVGDAVNNEWLLWLPATEELLSLFDGELMAAGRYRFSTIRNRYDTARSAHLSGAECWLFDKATIAASGLELPAPFDLEVFKLQPVVNGSALDLAEASPVSLAPAQRAARPRRPLNLRGNDSAAPTYTTGGNMPLTWNTALDDRLDFWSIVTDLPGTRLEFYDAADTLKATRDLDPGVESYAYLNATLVADLGSEQNFSVRAYHLLNGIPSRLHATLNVTLI